jgi:hypothetical protein
VTSTDAVRGERDGHHAGEEESQPESFHCADINAEGQDDGILQEMSRVTAPIGRKELISKVALVPLVSHAQESKAS